MVCPSTLEGTLKSGGAQKEFFPALHAGQVPPLFVPAPLPINGVYRSTVKQRWAQWRKSREGQGGHVPPNVERGEDGNASCPLKYHGDFVA